MANNNITADITDLFANTKDEDPEELYGFGEDARRLYDEDDIEFQELGGSRQSKSGPSRLRLRGDLVLQGPEYSGKSSSRKVLLGEEEEPDDHFPEFSEDEFNEESDEDVKKLDGGFESVENEEMEALDREYAQLRFEEEQVLRSVKPKTEDDIKKGKAVAHQKALWDRMLEFRISLQKPLQSSCRLPHPSVQQILIQESSPLSEGYRQLAKSAKSVLNSLLSLQKGLMENNPAIKSSFESNLNENGKRGREDLVIDWSSDIDETPTDSLDGIWRNMEQWYARLSPFRDISVDRWNRKIQFSTGASASKGKLRALNQTVSQQVSSAMTNSSRLVERTRVRLDVAKPLCQKGVNAEAELQENDEKNVVSQNVVNSETYEDTDFYQQLLKEFLETSDPGALDGASIRSLRKLRNNKKKMIDHRASKDRKVKYTVIPQLVNFMAPEPKEIPLVAQKLFTNLFGKNT